jgi:hypothetical protein
MFILDFLGVLRDVAFVSSFTYLTCCSNFSTALFLPSNLTRRMIICWVFWKVARVTVHSDVHASLLDPVVAEVSLYPERLVILRFLPFETTPSMNSKVLEQFIDLYWMLWEA